MTGSIWPLVRLGDVAGKPQYGWTSAAKPDAAGPPLLRTTDITRGPIDWAMVPKAVTSPPDVERYLLFADDIVVSRAGSVGASALIASPPAAVFASYLMRLRPGPDVAPRYLKLYLESPAYWAQISNVTNGIALPNINASKLADVVMPLPPRRVQESIVEILEDHLSRLDQGRHLLDEAGHRLTAWHGSVLDGIVKTHTSAFGTLGDLVDRVEAGRSFGGSAPPAREDEWGVVKVSAMTWGRFKPEENKAVPADRVDRRFEIRAGDVLVSRANTTEYVGAPVLVESTPPMLLLSDKSLRLVPKSFVDPRWLVRVLAAPSSRRQVSARATGTKDSMRNISQASLLAIEVPQASAAEQERAISLADAAESASALAGEALRTARSQAVALRRALLETAFRGRLTALQTDDEAVKELAGV